MGISFFPISYLNLGMDSALDGCLMKKSQTYVSMVRVVLQYINPNHAHRGATANHKTSHISDKALP